MLRGLAAALVVVAHVLEHPLSGPKPNVYLLTGRFGVEIFFVISGFIIFYIAGNASFNPAHFAVRRLFRIVPLYWLCTSLVLATVFATPQLYKTTVFDLGHYFSSLFFIPDPDPNNANDWRPIFKLGWTLNYEMFFYSIMLALFWCKNASIRLYWLTGILSTLVLLACLLPAAKSVGTFYANLNIIPFLMGVWIAYLFERIQFDGVRTLLLGGASVSTLAFYQVNFTDTRTAAGHLAMSVTAALIVLAGLANEKRVASLHAPLLNGLKAVGDSSYSLYLTHMFIVGAGWAVINRLQPGFVVTAIAALAMIVTALIVAYYSFLYLERPFNTFARQLTSRSPPADYAALRGN